MLKPQLVRSQDLVHPIRRNLRNSSMFQCKFMHWLGWYPPGNDHISHLGKNICSKEDMLVWNNNMSFQHMAAFVWVAITTHGIHVRYVYLQIHHEKSTKCRYIDQSHGCYGSLPPPKIPVTTSMTFTYLRSGIPRYKPSFTIGILGGRG